MRVFSIAVYLGEKVLKLVCLVVMLVFVDMDSFGLLVYMVDNHKTSYMNAVITVQRRSQWFEAMRVLNNMLEFL